VHCWTSCRRQRMSRKSRRVPTILRSRRQTRKMWKTVVPLEITVPLHLRSLSRENGPGGLLCLKTQRQSVPNNDLRDDWKLWSIRIDQSGYISFICRMNNLCRIPYSLINTSRNKSPQLLSISRKCVLFLHSYPI
jgi:hypothetical protein